jgi:hypothetical protein
MTSSDYPPPPPGPDPYGQAPPPPPPAYGGYGQQPYGYGGGYPQAPETESLAVGALVCSIASWTMCWFLPLPAIAGVVLASRAEDAIRASGGTKTGDGLAKAAKIISWIHIGVFVAALVIIVLIAVIAAATGS